MTRSSMTDSRRLVATTFAIATLLVTVDSLAVSPTSIKHGQELFEREWQSRSPLLGSDGLGPFFNAKSCVACHHQGGVGGGGDARFNAHSVGIERFEFVAGQSGARVSDSNKRRLIREFYPGLLRSDGSIVNSATLHHHGGSIEFTSIRNRMLEQMSGVRSDQGGAMDPEAARSMTESSIYYDSRTHGSGNVGVLVEAKLFQRNTTALFGSGAIDQITERQIRDQVKLQKTHSEISGRPSVLQDGSIGRFGWRANAEHLVNFVEQACVNELSLQTKSRRQSADPARPDYLNPGVDISDQQIKQMTEFIASLPQPTAITGRDSDATTQVEIGRNAFVSVGCAVCHVPNMGPAKGVYSDILLHDMGPNLYDRDAAGPHVTRMQLTTRIEEVPGTRIETYYGSPTSVSSPGERSVPTQFTSPTRSESGNDFVRIKAERIGRQRISSTGLSPLTRTETTAEMAKSTGLMRTLKASNTTQEWRTPPLWGVADSAPYMHDGRAETLLESIGMHDGEAAGTRDRFLDLPIAQRRAVITFLESLVAPNVPQPQTPQSL